MNPQYNRDFLLWSLNKYSRAKSLRSFFTRFFFLCIGALYPFCLTLHGALPLSDHDPETQKIPSLKASLESLTSSEKIEFLTTRQKALADPAVESTGEITRMALHSAMLKVDPSINTILANMDNQGPESQTSGHQNKKNFVGDFKSWLANFPSNSVASLTSNETETLEHAYNQALLDPSVQEARKNACLIFYNAMMNADPLIVPILSKAGIDKPSSIQPLSEKSHIESENRILGSDFQAWGKEILAPAIENQQSH
jgi:hypothetical protein